VHDEETNMAAVTLTVFGRGKTLQVEPKATGTIIGRSAKCDVVIDSRDVSREHARIFQDPYGRWIVEDLGSSNGVFINGKRIEACAVLPGEPIVIGSFSLRLSESFDQEIKPDDSIQASTNIIVEDFETEIFYGKKRAEQTTTRPLPKQLDEIVARLSELTSPSSLYPEACRYLAQAPRMAAVVVRVPAKNKPLPKSPIILACHFGDSPAGTSGQTAVGFDSSRLAFRVSRHVLEEARSKDDAVMAKSIYSSDEEITSTAVDEHSPRAVICAPVGGVTDVIDLLYVDIPIDEATRAQPEEMFEFVRAVSREVVATRKNLTLMQVKAEKSTLDHELSLAQKFQARLAPTVPQELSGVDLAVYYEPVIWVGGDYCDAWSLKDGRLAFAVGDISGSGLPAAMVMCNLRTALRTTMSFCSEPSDVMKHVNAHLIQDLPEGVHATLFLGLYDASKGTLEYVNAGHLQPLVVHPGSTVGLLGEPDNPALGGSSALFQTKARTIERGAQLLVITDGVTRANSPDGEEFGMKRVLSLLKTAQGRSARQIVDSVVGGVTDFRQTLAQQDDITVLALVNQK